MIQLPNSITFTRKESDGIYYADLNASLKNSVKFDIFDKDNQIATLITNNRKALTLTRDNIILSLKRKYNWLNQWYYYLSDNKDNLVATIYVHKPLLFNPNKKIYKISFEDSGITYFLSRKADVEFKKLKVNYSYNLLVDKKIKCTVSYSMNISLGQIFRGSSLNGAVTFYEDINITEVLCFLQLVNIHIDLESSS